MTATTFVAVLVLAGGTLALRLAGPALLRDREPPPWLGAVAVAAVAGMVVVGTVEGAGGAAVDARLVGVGVALLAVARRLPMAVVIVLAVAATAAARLLAG